MELSSSHFYRILIIDGEIAGNDVVAMKCRNLLGSKVNEVVNEAGQGGKCHVLPIIEIADSPVDGLERWQDEIFDLTLIGSDYFSLLKQNDLNGEKSQKNMQNVFLESNHQGFNVLRFLDNMVSVETNRFYHRRDMCNFFLWSDLRHDSDIDSLFKQFSLENKQQDYLIPKPEDWCDNDSDPGFERIMGIITDGVKKTINNDFSWEQKIERFIFAFQKNYARCGDRFQGGCLLVDNARKFPFLELLTNVDAVADTGVSAGAIKVMPSRIPAMLLSPKEPETLFFPLLSRSKSLSEALDFIENIKQSVTWKIVSEIKLRKQLLSGFSGRPVYMQPNSETDRLSADSECPEKILGYSFKNYYIAAATPLTGISVIGEKYAVEALAEKVLALLNGPAGAVVLKTAYLNAMDQWDGVNWPAIQVQSHMRSRCLKPNRDMVLWNSGRTALEMLPPVTLNKLLKKIKGKIGDTTHRVIVSLGSKFFQEKGSTDDAYKNDQQKIWSCLFSQVFAGLNGCYPLVEINVRHFLREIVKKHLGGDEYLNPVDLSQEIGLQTESYWNDFEIWLHNLHDTAVQYGKKIIMKMPHRSDTLAYVHKICSLRELHKKTAEQEDREFGVRGFTLINALKTPVPMGTEKRKKFSPGWYAHPWSWNDAGNKIYKYQMSGALLTPYRNQIMAGLMGDEALQKLRDNDMEILLSGGITDENFNEWKEILGEQEGNESDIISGIQIGTYGLLQTEITKPWGVAK